MQPSEQKHILPMQMSNYAFVKVGIGVEKTQ